MKRTQKNKVFVVTKKLIRHHLIEASSYKEALDFAKLHPEFFLLNKDVEWQIREIFDVSDQKNLHKSVIRKKKR